MARTNVAPTKTNLIKYNSELKFAHLGYELLDQKRNILINKGMSGGALEEEVNRFYFENNPQKELVLVNCYRITHFS